MCFEFDYWVNIDGGASANGTADSFGYGSYHLEARNRQKQVIWLQFGRGVTNIKAEYRTLIAALKDLVARIQGANAAPRGYILLVHTDFQPLVSQFDQGWQVKAASPSTSSDQAPASRSTRQCARSKPSA